MSIGNYAFYKCSNLTSITIPDSVTSIGDYAFYECSNLTSITIPDSVTSIGYGAFSGCSGLTGSLTIPNSVMSIGDSAFDNCSSLTSITIPTDVTSIGNGVFSDCDSLTDITIPTSVTSIGNSAFYNCSSLTGITIPTGVTSIGDSAFRGCSSLTGITIPTGVTSIGNYTFYDCSSLTSITIPGSVTSIGSSVFSGCNCLASIDVHENNPNYASVDGVLYNKGKTTLIFCPKRVTSIVIPNSITSIKKSVFSGCISLTSITIPDSVTSIGDSAFYECSRLTSITIPKSVLYIGKFAFLSSGLRNVYYTSTEAEWAQIAIEYGNNELFWANRFYPDDFSAPTAKDLTYTGIAIQLVSGGNDGMQYALGADAQTAPASGWNTDVPSAKDVGTYYVWYRFIDKGPTCLTVKISACSHNWDTGIVTTEPTTGKEGIKTYTCTVCKETKTEAVPKLPAGTGGDKQEANKQETNKQESETTPLTKDYTGFVPDESGTSFWYENGVKQGVKLKADGKPDLSYRGKEIYDPVSDEWYWLDNIQYGAIARSKDVYQESQADDEGNIGKWVRYDENGHMVKGWDTNQKGAYYFDPIYGTMLKGDQVIDGVNYHFDEVTGIMTYCSISLENHWEIIDGVEYWYENGQRQGRDVVHKSYRGKEIYDPVSDAWYWLDNVDAGKKAVSKDVYQESGAGPWGEKIGKWVRYDAEGRMIKGWCAGKGTDAVRIDSPDQSDGRSVYYFDWTYGTMAKGEATIDGITYTFDLTTGILQK